MNNLDRLNGWSESGKYISRNSAQSYLASAQVSQASVPCGSSFGSKDGDAEPKPSACGSGDSNPKPSACGAGGDNGSKPSACGAGDEDNKPKPAACGS